MIDPATAAAALLLATAQGTSENAPVLSISTEVSTELPPELQPPILECVIWPAPVGARRHHHAHRRHHHS